MSARKDWKKFFGCKEYVCPNCKRDKGMIYLFQDGTIRYVCFCGTNITIDWIKETYNFDKKTFSKNEKTSLVKKQNENKHNL